MSRACWTASSKIARTRSKSSTALSTCVHWIHPELNEGSYYRTSDLLDHNLKDTTYRKELLIQHANPVKLAQPHLKLDVAGKQFRLGTHADSRSEHLARGGDVQLPDLEEGIR